MWRLRASAVVVLVGGLVAACGSSDRPEELSMDDVTACDVVSADDFDELDVGDGPHPEDAVHGADMEGNSCLYHTRQATSVTISTITNHGLDWQIDGPSDHASRKLPAVHGLRTVEVWRNGYPPDADDECELYVDVANDQMMRVEASKPSSHGDRCDTAHRFAEAAVGELLGN